MTVKREPEPNPDDNSLKPVACRVRRRTWAWRRRDEDGLLLAPGWLVRSGGRGGDDQR